MKKFTVCLTAILLAFIGCFTMIGCNDDGGDTSGCYLDEKSPAFATAYYATVTDYDIAEKVSIGGNDYSSDYENGKFVIVTVTIQRSTGADDVIFTRDWFTLKVGDKTVSLSDSMYTDFYLNVNAAKSVDLRFDVENASGDMKLEIAQPDADEEPVVINLDHRK